MLLRSQLLAVGLVAALTFACGGSNPSGGDAGADAGTDVAGDPSSDAGCGDATCADDASCVDGVCVSPCPDGATDCGGACVDTDTDALHCGACDAPCEVDETCVDRVCEPRCEPDEAICDDACTDTTADPLHCGDCGTRCAAAPGASPVCVDSVCATTCDDGFVDLDPDAPGCEYACTRSADAEVACDGFDDDCDGLVDADDGDFAAPPCARTLGVCAGAVARCDTGSAVCDADVYRAVAGDRPWQDVAESWCDGLDNDCDGVADEGCCGTDGPSIDAPPVDDAGPVLEEPVFAAPFGDGLHVVTRYADLRADPRVLATRLHRLGPAGGVDPAPVVLDDDRVYEVAAVPIDGGYGVWIANESGLAYGEVDTDGAVTRPFGPVDGVTDRYSARVRDLRAFAQPDGATLIAVVDEVDDEVLGEIDVTELIRWDGEAVTGFFRAYAERLYVTCAATTETGHVAIAVQRGAGSAEILTLTMSENLILDDRDDIFDVDELHLPFGTPIPGGCTAAAVEADTGDRYRVQVTDAGGEAVVLPRDTDVLDRFTAAGHAATGGRLHAWARDGDDGREIVVRAPDDGDTVRARFAGPGWPMQLIADGDRTWLVGAANDDVGGSTVFARPLTADGAALCVDADAP